MMFVLSVGALGLFSAGVTRVPSAHAVGAGPTANAPTTPRRAALALGARAAVGGILLPLATPLPAAALVKGSAPPKTMKPRKDRPTCTSIDDCRAVGEAERDAIDATAEEDFKRTAGGDRYRDLAIGSGQAASRGDAVQLRYRVMRLGTRARDGLSGEGQTIFSLGFGEDEDKEGDTLVTPLDGQSLVAGINDAVIGMQTGGRRRVLVWPERGWKEQTAACADIVFRADSARHAKRSRTRMHSLRALHHRAHSA